MLLERLGAAILGDRRAVLTQTIQGMGGVGKTTAAVALANAHRHRLDVVWWVRAERPGVLVADLAELAPRVGLITDDDPSVTANAVREWLEATDRTWLLVFDNASDEASVEPWHPRRGGGITLITSRNRNMNHIGSVLAVDAFPNDVADAFLRDRVRPLNPLAADEDLRAVLDRLGGLPLALEQAAAWVERAPNRRFGQYTRLFDDAAAEPFPEGTRPLGYEHTAATAWRVSVDAATSEAPCARRLLAVLGFLGSDGLPCAWLRARAEAGDPYLHATPVELDDALVALHGYSLVELTGADTISVHRVVQAAARREAASGAAGCAISLLRAQADGEPRNVPHWPVLSALIPHVLAALATANAAFPEHARDMWWVLNDLTSFSRSRGAFAQAIDVGTLALDLATIHLGPEHPDTLTARANLAASFQSARRTSEAIAMKEEVLADRENLLGPEHPDTLTARANLAVSYWSAGRLAEALAIGAEVLAERERILGPEHPDTLRARADVAVSLRLSGRAVEAIPIDEAVLAARERVLGREHHDTLSSRASLALSYDFAGLTTEAIAAGEQCRNRQLAAPRERSSGHACCAGQPDPLLRVCWTIGRGNRAWRAGRG